MKRTACLLTAVILVFSACCPSGSAADGSGYEADIALLHENGVINRNQSGFDPEEPITVGKFLSCLENILTEEKFISGIDSFFYAGAIRFGFENNILDNRIYPDIRRSVYGTYRQIDGKLLEQSADVYGAPLRRGQTAQILLCAMKEPAGGDPKKALEKISDIGEAEESERDYLCTAWQKGIFETDTEGNIYPNRPVTLGEACRYLNLAFFQPEKRVEREDKFPGNIKVKQICKLNSNAALLLDQEGTLWGWGVNGENELGFGYQSGFTLYPQVIAQDVVKCWTGLYEYFYLTENHELWHFTTYQDIFTQEEPEPTARPYLLKDNVLDFCNTGYDAFMIDTDNVLFQFKTKMFGGDALTMGATFLCFDAVQVETDGTLCFFVLKKDGSLYYSDFTKGYFEKLDEEVEGLYGSVSQNIPMELREKYPSVLYYTKKNGEKYALTSRIEIEEGVIQVGKARINTSEKDCAFVSDGMGIYGNYHTRLYITDDGELWAEALSSGKKEKLLSSVNQVVGGPNFGLAVTDAGIAYQIAIRGEDIHIFSF